MERMFKKYPLGDLELVNRFVFPPIKLAYGKPDGTVTDRQLLFYQQVAKEGPGLLILEPVSVTPDGREHPKQLCVHHPGSGRELKKIVDVIHGQGRLVCLHLNHAGGAANPKATKSSPRAPSPFTCPSSGQTSEALTDQEIDDILEGYRSAAAKAVEAGFDAIEIQAGHGYLVSQFLNPKINRREDPYGKDRLLFARRVLSMVKEGAPDLLLILRLSGDEMAPGSGLSWNETVTLLELAEKEGIGAVHVGMGNACFSPPWYFHHASLPEGPQWDALAGIRKHTDLPLIVAGRMGRAEKVQRVLDDELAELVALGRPLVADPDLLEKWEEGFQEKIIHCGYCLQGCLHRVKSGEGLGCNVNPEIGRPELGRTDHPLKVLVAGGGPAGMSAARFLAQKGHHVTLAEEKDRLGGGFDLAWKAPGKEEMKATLDSLRRTLAPSGVTLLLGRSVDPGLVEQLSPDLLVWAVGAVQNLPEIPGLDNQYTLTSLEYFSGQREVKGKRILIIGAGRVGLEIAENLGRQSLDVTATKRTDPIGSNMEMVSRNLILKRLSEMKNVRLMPHTTVKAFTDTQVVIEQDGENKALKPFDTVILASGLISAPGPGEEIRRKVPRVEVIGDAAEVLDIYSATLAGYQLAGKY